MATYYLLVRGTTPATTRGKRKENLADSPNKDNRKKTYKDSDMEHRVGEEQTAYQNGR